MATTQVFRADLFPAGTVVKVFELLDPLPGEYLSQAGDPTGWTPAMSAPVEVTVAEDGSLAITTEEAVKRYLLAAEVGGEWQYLVLANNAGGDTISRLQVEGAVKHLEPESTEPNLSVGSSYGAPKGEGNTSYGLDALEELTTGQHNTAFGRKAGAGISTGSENVFIGDGTGNNCGGAAKGNVVIGVSAGAGEALTGDGNIVIGREARTRASGQSNRLVIANNGSTSIIEAVMSATAASQQLSFFGAVPVSQPKIGATAAATPIGEALIALGLCAE